MKEFLEQLVSRRQGGKADEPTSAAGTELPRSRSEPGDAAGNAEKAAFEAGLRAHQIRVIAQSGMFDEAYYLETYQDIRQADISALDHFFSFGYKEGRRPNPYFEPIWYLEQHGDVAETQLQPLFHYALHGDKQGRDPGPLFRTAWYRDRYGIGATENALSHYLANNASTPLSPIPEFDADFYAAHNSDVVAAGVDLFQHFITYGYKECRNPSEAFDVKFYTDRYLHGDREANPFLHYLRHKTSPGVFGRLPDDAPTVSRELKRFTKPAPEFEEFRGLGHNSRARVKLLAYYLPQFHAFRENDAWWGKGFTEWTNIARGSPRFVGHYQPRIPRDLGFYSLGSAETMRRQIDLAQAAGVHGFVFYYYWFNGKRLMEKPLEQLLADPALDMPFALMWANENWTRRWDGADSELLISQDYRPEDDAMMLAEFAACFRDRRYIRLKGRPVLMIYRPGLIPRTAETIERWRTMLRREFGEDPIFVMSQSFGAADPREFGMDGAIEFPPHKLTSDLAPANAGFRYLDYDFAGKIYHYEDVVRVSLDESHPSYPLIKTAVPSWDNDARRQGGGIVLANATPAKYEAWLSGLVDIATGHPFFGEPIVCVNAWNEWCEGAYLEPDLHFGAAYLNATARVVAGRVRETTAPKIVLIGHDAFPSGAQQLLLGIGHMLRSAFGMECEFLLLDSGLMLAQYEEEAPTTVVASDAHLAAKLRSLAESGFLGALVNTSAAARATAAVRAAGLRSVLQIHELPRIVREKGLAENARAGLLAADHVTFAAPFVRDAFLVELGVVADRRMVIMPQGSYKSLAFNAGTGQAVREEFGLAPEDRMVLGAGYADLRKGFDLFLQLWRLMQNEGGGSRTCLVWVGGMDPGLQDWLRLEIAEAEARGTFRMAGYRDDMEPMFSAADAFALTSREDPFPTVVLEALSVGLPVSAFERAGGIPDMLREAGEGEVVPYGDVPAMARALGRTMAARISPQSRARRRALVAERFDFRSYARSLLSLALPELPSVSVVVPNYNYAHFLPQRLESIFQQSHPVQEVIVLDDCSTDDSLSVVPTVARAARRIVRLVPNTTNSGSVFAQWRRAAELATGEFLWIAEADDLSDRGFLLDVLAVMAKDPSVHLGFSDSRTINADGSAQWASYKDYYAGVEPGALERCEVFDAGDFVTRFLSVKNLMLNVSAVVWRREPLLHALRACEERLRSFRMAGDWWLYLEVLCVPGVRVAYVGKALNVHRRHAQSVTHALDGKRHVAEIRHCQTLAARKQELSPALLGRQAAYLEEVAGALGVPSVGGRRPAPPRARTGKAAASRVARRTNEPQ